MFKIVNILEISINIENLENRKQIKNILSSSDIFFLPIFYYKKI